MASLRLLFVMFLYGCITVQGQKPHSCADIYKSNILQASGVYTIFNRQQQPFQVYCDFKKGFGYTYIAPNISVSININDLYTNTSHVIIRDLRLDGTQYESRVEQITAFKSTPLSIQYNSFTGYQSVLNTKMSPYVYIGLLPKAMSHGGQTEGFRTNGHEVTFRNCDNNGNSYFAFLFNKNQVSEVPYAPAASAVTKLLSWDHSLPSTRYLPQYFYTPYEFHFGGCGGYATPRDLRPIKAAAVGLRFDISCSKPDDVARAQYSTSGMTAGSRLTYTCDTGYTVLSGDKSRVCAETGKWTGVKPFCGQFPCESGPCLNGGACFEIEGKNYVCECREGFVGTHCEKSL